MLDVTLQTTDKNGNQVKARRFEGTALIYYKVYSDKTPESKEDILDITLPEHYQLLKNSLSQNDLEILL